jgi:hypothetical protein
MKQLELKLNEMENKLVIRLQKEFILKLKA